MTDLQHNTLRKFIGVIKSSNGKNITINKIVPQDGFVVLHCTGGNRNLNDDEIDGFIAGLGEPLTESEIRALATQNNAPAAPENFLQGYTPTAENVEVKSILMDTLRGIKSGEIPVAQGKAVFDGVHALVAVQKQEIDMIRLMNKK